MFIPLKKTFQISTCLGILAISFLQSPVYSQQVIEDGTLPTRVKTTDNLNFTIDSINNQNRVGNNLFHSFKEFSIPTGGSAIFNNSTDVVNIINRVTGGNISNIDGLIKANGNANLFLINPAGIIFGKNASLDIGGSFFGSTAESIKFSDDIEFSAINITKPPLLSINVPLGLQMGSNSGGIEVQGEGYNNINDGRQKPFIVNNVNGLQVKAGNTLALVAGEISLNGGVVTADSGKVELGSVKEGLVNINSTPDLILGYEDVEKFGDIKFNSKALADASGTVNGSIKLQGRNISIKDGSRVFIQSRGLQSGEKIEVNATESIEVIGTNSDGSLGTTFFSETVGIGNAAEIIFSAPNLIVSQGAGITTRSFSLGRGGNITVNASESLEISQFSPINPTNDSQISTVSFQSGAAGDINISTKELSILGQKIISTNYNIAYGGNVFVSADNLTVLDGGSISSTTLGIGKGGNVDINSQFIEVKGFNFDIFTPSGLGAATVGIGNAGNLTVNTESLIVKDGGRVDSSTLASGAAGSVTVNATDFVEVNGTVPGSVNPSLIISSANIVDELLQQAIGLSAIPSGDSGNVNINTPLLKVSDGAEVTVKNDGTGKGGILN
ncbi:MAG: filamentous hemagglutinin N-terminal domain-containing protein, partial [Cyanobacteriota bacterium]|nr:filamentous hemagglutinin N-terminal domain-containing protein [Cyanobacteriota bacterium]